MNENLIYIAYEGDDFIGKYNSRDEAKEALDEARREAGAAAKKRIYRVETRRRREGE